MAYFDLGNYTRPVSTASADAQRWFDRGLTLVYGFNHEEAERCFRKAAKRDPGCAMAWWGIAYALGPNYNKPWESFDDKDLAKSLKKARKAAERAQSAAANCTEVERDLADAILERYQSVSPREDLEAWNDAYADSMRRVYAKHKDDSDVAALFAEALMNRTPWALWDLETGGVPDGADTEEVVAVLERGMRLRDTMDLPPHAGLAHLYIHAIEMSPNPERALPAADELRDMVPDAGHLVHMPSHIYVICGDYSAVRDVNQAAVRADRKFLKRRGAVNFFSLYRCHNLHFVIYAGMLLGQFRPAAEAAEELIETLPADLLRIESPPMADWLEGFVGMKQHVLIRFGKWREILEQELPDDPELFCATTAVMRYARTVANAVLGNLREADSEFGHFEAALARLPESRMVFNNTCLGILAVAREMAIGETEFRRGSFETAFKHLREAVRFDDNLEYDEPWAWMQPARHALGALLLERGEAEQAAAVYREDLGLDPVLKRQLRHPNNVWSLHGYHECLQQLGRVVEAAEMRQQLDIALARADVEISASCFCRRTAH